MIRLTMQAYDEAEWWIILWDVLLVPGAGRTPTTDWGGIMGHHLLYSTGQVHASYEEGLVDWQGGGTGVSREKLVHGTIVREIGHQELWKSRWATEVMGQWMDLWLLDSGHGTAKWNGHGWNGCDILALWLVLFNWIICYYDSDLWYLDIVI